MLLQPSQQLVELSRPFEDAGDNDCRSALNGACGLHNSCCYSPRHVELDSIVAPAASPPWLRLIDCDIAVACWLVGQTSMVRALASANVATSSFLLGPLRRRGWSSDSYPPAS